MAETAETLVGCSVAAWSPPPTAAGAHLSRRFSAGRRPGVPDVAQAGVAQRTNRVTLRTLIRVRAPHQTGASLTEQAPRWAWERVGRDGQTVDVIRFSSASDEMEQVALFSHGTHAAVPWSSRRRRLACPACPGSNSPVAPMPVAVRARVRPPTTSWQTLAISTCLKLTDP